MTRVDYLLLAIGADVTLPASVGILPILPLPVTVICNTGKTNLSFSCLSLSITINNIILTEKWVAKSIK